MGRMVGRETLTGVAIGLTLALIAGPLVWWHWNNSGLGVSVGVSVFAASSTATVVAMALPWILRYVFAGSRIGERAAGDGHSGSPVDLDLPSRYRFCDVMSRGRPDYWSGASRVVWRMTDGAVGPAFLITL